MKLNMNMKAHKSGQSDGESLFPYITGLFRIFGEWLYPNRCIGCYELLEDLKADCCQLCYNELKMITKDYCEKCGKVHESKAPICFDCSKVSHSFQMGRGVFVYEGIIKKSLFGLKFFKQTWLGERFGRILADYYRHEGLWDVDLIIPVPLHLFRYLERGYNQAEIIARTLGLDLDLPCDSQVLYRKKMTKPQKNLKDDERIHNLDSAFKVKKRDRIVGKKILLIDDIYTTGATIDSCAKALLDEGASEIYFLTLAIGRGY